MSAQTKHFYSFGPFRLDSENRVLVRDGAPVPLAPKLAETLLMLVERAGYLVDKDALMKRVWPEAFVEEGNLNKNIFVLRKLLGLWDGEREYIETVPKRGYRFVAPVNEVTHAEVAQRSQTSMVANLIGEKVSHYRVLEIVGGGGMGLVYRAEDLKLGRGVALKFLPSELANDPVALERFEHEARAASALDHPNICAVHEFGEHDGKSFIVMQLLKGQTLRDRITATANKGAPFQTGELLTFAAQIADGLAAAHRQDIIHRDIKPANIFITNRGVAKILDFGLVKRASAGTMLTIDAVETAPNSLKGETAPLHLSLTLTGATLGTAAYMSPEQVRGEPLDTRSDLFSFGLVLYEMATGRQAFGGATAAVVHDAIESRSPVPVRYLNSAIPAKLEAVINKALEKNRERRYQSAAEMREELLQLKEKAHPSRWAIAAGLVLPLAAFVLVWFATRPPSIQPEIKQTQLTANSSEDTVTSSAISPDGKYLAYSDRKGIHLKLLATGETRTLSQTSSEWYFAWFPDSTRFLASEISRPGIWSFSVMGGAPRKFREDGTVNAVSPDASSVAFTANTGRVGDREIWLVGANGTNLRKFLEVGEYSSVQSPYWSPDGQRISYYTQRQNPGKLELSVESRDLNGGAPVAVYSETATTPERTKLQDFVWLPGGRIIFSLADPDSGLENSFSVRCNLWELRIDPSTGRPSGALRRLTNWPAGAIVTYLNATSDGKRLSALRMTKSVSIYHGRLDTEGRQVSAAGRLTATEGWNNTPAWTEDSRAIFFESNRDGRLHIFRQEISADIAEPIETGPGESSVPLVSPDGSFLLYLASAHSTVGGSSTPVQLMRVPSTGGPPQQVLSASIFDLPRCSRVPARLCVIAEPAEDHKQMIFSAFDPLQGRGRELARIDVDPNADYGWDISPDGSRIALLKRMPRTDGKIYSSEGVIHVFSWKGERSQEIRIKGAENFREFVDWAADGKGLILSHRTGTDSELISVDLKGNAKVLWHEEGAISFRGVPSPDGRHLAILRESPYNNVWMIENF